MTITQAAFADAEVLETVTDRLDRLFTERIAAAGRLDARYRALWEHAQLASRGGKKFRPALVLGAYREFGGQDAETAVVVACAFELLHTAFLLHDDVIDQDTVRRGRLNLAGSFAADACARGIDTDAAESWGNASAILAGDLLIHVAQSLVSRLVLAEETRGDLLDLLDESVFVSAAGELADVSFSSGVHTPALADVLLMAERKTAHYSFAGPLKAGAILAGASPIATWSLGEFGRLIGVAFQLRDDVLGVFGAPSDTGKSVTSDLQTGKTTALIVHARTTRRWDAVAHLLGRPNLTDADIGALRAALEECGARAYVEELARDYAIRALAIADASNLPYGLMTQLRVVADDAVERVS